MSVAIALLSDEYASGTSFDYALHRIKTGVPEGVVDMAEAIPFERNVDVMGAGEFRVATLHLISTQSLLQLISERVVMLARRMWFALITLAWSASVLYQYNSVHYRQKILGVSWRGSV